MSFGPLQPEVAPSPVQSLQIGGFFPLEQLPGETASALGTYPSPSGLLLHWGVTSPAQTWHRASDAWLALLRHLRQEAAVSQVWLPAVICHIVAEAVVRAGLEKNLKFYGDLADGSPDLEKVTRLAAPQALVLVLNFMGRTVAEAQLAALRSRPDLLCVEDCAHTLESGPVTSSEWADWRLLSPRKLLGLPDGGILLACSARARTLQQPLMTHRALAPISSDDEALWIEPHRLRRLARSPEHLAAAWRLFKEREVQPPWSEQAMTALAWQILCASDGSAISRARRRNYLRLRAALLGRDAETAEAVAAHGTRVASDLSWTPFSLELEVLPGEAPPVDTIRHELHRFGLFTGVYWPDLPSNSQEFPREHERNSRRLVLPCDQRYSAEQMQQAGKLAAAVLKMLGASWRLVEGQTTRRDDAAAPARQAPGPPA